MSEATIPEPERPSFTPGYGVEGTTQGLLTWEWVRQRLTESRNYWLATTRANGKPHAAPVWGVWLDDALYFGTDPKSVKGRNLQFKHDLVVHLESGDEVVILEGDAHLVTNAATLEQVDKAYSNKYGFDPGSGESDDSEAPLYCFRTRRAFAWREQDFPHTATRWRFT